MKFFLCMRETATSCDWRILANRNRERFLSTMLNNCYPKEEGERTTEIFCAVEEWF